MKPLIIANWKMNPANSKDAFDLALAVQNGLQRVGVNVVLCPPFVYIPQLLASDNVFIGAQDCFWEQEGAYTGEVSPQMLKNLGCSYVILGHSERKKLGETLKMTAQKTQAALLANLVPVVCIGEHITEEMKSILKEIPSKDVSRIVFVYEPEWAISTQPNAKPATPKEAQAAFKKMRSLLLETSTLLYGGSVNSKNIKEFMEAGAAGALVGAASLDAQEFILLAKNAVSR